jgi:hypothetical protein
MQRKISDKEETHLVSSPRKTVSFINFRRIAAPVFT